METKIPKIPNYKLRPFKKAFRNAWARGAIEEGESWMYIYSDDEFDHFKHNIYRWTKVPY